jgi:hypothetical protein
MSEGGNDRGTGTISLRDEDAVKQVLVVSPLAKWSRRESTLSSTQNVDPRVRVT